VTFFVFPSFFFFFFFFFPYKGIFSRGNILFFGLLSSIRYFSRDYGCPFPRSHGMIMPVLWGGYFPSPPSCILFRCLPLTCYPLFSLFAVPFFPFVPLSPSYQAGHLYGLFSASPGLDFFLPVYPVLRVLRNFFPCLYLFCEGG